MSLADRLQECGAPHSVVSWARDRDDATAWRDCVSPRDLIWLAHARGVSSSDLVRAALVCAESVPQTIAGTAALVLVRRWVGGENIPGADLRAASTAAYAASTAYASTAAASTAAYAASTAAYAAYASTAASTAAASTAAYAASTASTAAYAAYAAALCDAIRATLPPPTTESAPRMPARLSALLSYARRYEFTAAAWGDFRQDADDFLWRKARHFRTDAERDVCITHPRLGFFCHYCSSPARDCCCVTRDGELAPEYTCGEHEYIGDECPDCNNSDGDYRIVSNGVVPVGTRTPWAPYYIGIEVETDSVPGRIVASLNAWTATPRLCMGTGTDGSVDGCESRTQPLRGSAAIEAIDIISRWASDCELNERCGLHMHVDMRAATERIRKAHVLLWMHCERELEILAGEHRKDNHYCVPLRACSAREQDTVRSLGAVDRYRALNISAYNGHQTHEIRLWGWPPDWSGSDLSTARYIYDRARVTWALRVAARHVGQSVGNMAQHPIFSLDAQTALAYIIGLVPHAPTDLAPFLRQTQSSLSRWGA